VQGIEETQKEKKKEKNQSLTIKEFKECM